MECLVVKSDRRCTFNSTCHRLAIVTPDGVRFRCHEHADEFQPITIRGTWHSEATPIAELDVVRRLEVQLDLANERLDALGKAIDAHRARVAADDSLLTDLIAANRLLEQLIVGIAP